MNNKYFLNLINLRLGNKTINKHYYYHVKRESTVTPENSNKKRELQKKTLSRVNYDYRHKNHSSIKTLNFPYNAPIKPKNIIFISPENVQNLDDFTDNTCFYCFKVNIKTISASEVALFSPLFIETFEKNWEYFSNVSKENGIRLILTKINTIIYYYKEILAQIPQNNRFSEINPVYTLFNHLILLEELLPKDFLLLKNYREINKHIIQGCYQRIFDCYKTNGITPYMLEAVLFKKLEALLIFKSIYCDNAEILKILKAAEKIILIKKNRITLTYCRYYNNALN